MESNGENMKKNVLLIIMIAILAFLGFARVGIWYFFFDTQNIKPGKYITESNSPDKTYTLKVYLNSQALSNDCILVVAVNNKNGEV